MESRSQEITAALLEDLYLLKREAACEKLASIFDGGLMDLCIQTRHPKQISRFISAYLARIGQLELGVGQRCYFIRDKDTWMELCSADRPSGQILVAEPELDFDSMRSDLLSQARGRGHAVIYSVANPRPDTANVVILIEPSEYDVRDALQRHGFPGPSAEKFAKQSNGNVYLLVRRLTGTPDRPAWLTENTAYQLRSLALLGGWDENSTADQKAIEKITGEPYDAWSARIYPLTRQSDPPLLLQGRIFRPLSRYEHWQLFAHQLTDADVRRFEVVAEEVLAQDENGKDLERQNFTLTLESDAREPRCSNIMRDGLAESLALLATNGHLLDCTPNLPRNCVDGIVRNLLTTKDWARWASLAPVLSKLAEASPSVFLRSLEESLMDLESSPLRSLFDERDQLFGRTYHPQLLWALELLAWSPDYLNRVCWVLVRMAKFGMVGNSGNSPAHTLSSIFLPWLPQTLATIEARGAAVECVIEEDDEVGWKLLLSLLPERHQTSMYNPRPVWRDWFPAQWREGVTRSEYLEQITLYSKLAVSLAIRDIKKLELLIDRWDRVPREIFERVFSFLRSEEALDLPDEGRYSIWERLISEVERHRKFADSDWSMPEDELERLEEAAEAIKVNDPLYLSRRLFNFYDHYYFESKDYEAERTKIAIRRDEAINEIISLYGASGLIGLAKSVSHPGEVGVAAGKLIFGDMDGQYLPELLEDSDSKVREFIGGYVRSCYWSKGEDWIKALELHSWRSELRVKFFCYLPFHAKIWQMAEEELGGDAVEYWKNIQPNPFQAGEEILEAAQKAIYFSRPDIAIGCINALLHEKQPVPVGLATEALTDYVRLSENLRQVDSYAILEILSFLQSSLESSGEAVRQIEFRYLELLGRHSSGRPLFLERHMAKDPAFFHEIISYCYKPEDKASEEDSHKLLEISSEKAEPGKEGELDGLVKKDEIRRILAKQSYLLLDVWSILPGTNPVGVIDEEYFNQWLSEVERLCRNSGHWSIAQQHVGHCLVKVPVEFEGKGVEASMLKLTNLLGFPMIMRSVDLPAREHIRRGMTTELFNSRGVHGYSAGAEEIKIASGYRNLAAQYDAAKFPRVATSLRELAESYDRHAEREAKLNPYG